MIEWAREMREAMILFRSAVMQRVETNTEVDVNVDVWRLANVASRNMGVRSYSDR
jgi:hypothetical protein